MEDYYTEQILALKSSLEEHKKQIAHLEANRTMMETELGRRQQELKEAQSKAT
jgi:chromosome segregation ATPase